VIDSLPQLGGSAANTKARVSDPQWKSQRDYENWVGSKDFKDCTDKINEVLDVPGKRTTIFKRPEEDIFLL
jgi:hypothetical protein